MRPAGPAPIVQALRTHLETAGQRLDAVLARTGARVEAGARQGMIDSLVRRLARLTARVLATQGPPAGGGDWSLPGELAGLVEQVTGDWLAAITELTRALAADHRGLEDRLLEGRALGALTAYQGDAGDAHDGGRSVACLRFEGGAVVYKPKDLRIADAFDALVRELPQPDLGLALRMPRRITSERYAWEEFVEAGPCHTEEEVRRFYLRLGMLLRLMQLLEARDLWLDNLIAAGEHPVFIDLETLLQPRWVVPAELSAEREAAELLRESVASIGILVMHTFIDPGIAAEDLGAVTPVRPLLTPFRHQPDIDAIAGQAHQHQGGYRTWSPRAYAPTLEGVPCVAGEHLDAIIEGYRRMQGCLGKSRASLLEPAGALAGLSGCQVRVILRHTWAYQRIIDASLAPALLSAPGVRAAALAAGAWESPGHHRLERVFAQERRALSRLDVPYFLCRSEGADILTAEGATVAAGVLEPSAYLRARARVEHIDSFAMGTHEAILVSAFGTGHGGRAPGQARRSVAHVDWLAEAELVGRFILDHSICRAGQRAWIGLAHDPLHDVSRLEVLGPELLSGNGGIAVALCELYLATGSTEFRDAGREALVGLERALLAETPPRQFGLLGLGGQLYAYLRCAGALGLSTAPLLATVARVWKMAGVPGDLLEGRLGLALVALSAGWEPVELGRFERATTASLGRDPVASPYPARARIRAAMAGAGRALALLRARLAHQVQPAGRMDDDLEKSWEPAEESGDLLVDLTMLPRGNALVTATESVRTRLAQGREHPVDLAWLALAGARATGDGSLHQEGLALGAALVEGRRLGGRWLPDPAADQHQLSSLWGLPALIELFLTLGRPGQEPPALRLVSPPSTGLSTNESRVLLGG